MPRHAIEHVEPCDRLRTELINFEPQRVKLCGNAVAMIHARTLDLAANVDSQIGALIEHHATLTYDWSTTKVLYAEPALADWTSPEYNADMFRTCVGALKKGSFEITGASYDPRLSDGMDKKPVLNGNATDVSFGFNVCSWSHYNPMMVFERFSSDELFELFAVLVGLIARAAAIRLDSGHQTILYSERLGDYSLVVSGKTVVKSLRQLSLEEDPFLSVWNSSLSAIKQINEFLDARHLQDEASHNSLRRWLVRNG